MNCVAMATTQHHIIKMAASIAILGGGISGLSTAYFLLKHGGNTLKKILVLERTDRLGGWLRTERFPDGTVYEIGPRSIRVSANVGMDTLALVEDLGIESHLIPIKAGHPATKNRLLMVNDELHPLPSGGIGSLFKRVDPFRRPLFFYALRDLLKRRKILEDDSMYGFAERRFGREIADLVIDPLCRGVFAGDSKRLSVRALLKDAFEAEQKHGSVIGGLLKRLQDKSQKKMNPDFALGEKALNDRWAMWNFEDGLEFLVNALTKKLNEGGVEIRNNTICKQLLNERESIQIETTNGTTFDCNHVFAALPAFELANIIRGNHSEVSTDLESISSVSVAVATLEFEGSPSELQIKPAFGFLVPSNQNPGLLGVVYDSCCFPEHDTTNQPRTRFTVMMGGSWFEDQFGDPNKSDKDILLKYAIDGVSRHLKISAKPIRSLINVNINCIPQYDVGHFTKVKRMREYVQNNELPLSLVGSSYDGVSVNDCITSAKLQVKQFLEKVGHN